VNPDNRITFSIDSHDRDGDVCEDGIFIHFGNTRIRVAGSFLEYLSFLTELRSMAPEIEKTLYNRDASG